MYKERKEAYDAECFIIRGEEIPYLKNIMISQLLDENDKIIDMMKENYEKEDHEGFEKSELLLNASISKKTFEGLKKQNQFKKINVIVYNLTRSYEQVLEDISNSYKDLIMTKKVLNEMEKKLNRAKSVDDIELPTQRFPTISREVANYIRNTEHFNEMKMMVMMDMTLSKEKKIESEVQVVIGAGVKCINNGMTIEDFTRAIDIGFRRFEIDFENEVIKVYKSYAKMSAARPKDFKPWNGHLHEELEYEKTFKECKKELTADYKFFLNQEEVFKEVTLGGIDSYETREEFEEAIAEQYGECPIDQLSTLSHEMARRLIDTKVLGALSFILNNNLIKKEVERTRVLKKSSSNKKKAKGVNQYKSIVKEWYIYDEEKVNEFVRVLDENVEEEKSRIQLVHEMQLKQKEKRDTEEYTYQKEEWEVKPHVRTLKDGRKVLISGQKRKRRKELLETESNEPNATTYGMTMKDVEKIVKNATT